MTGKKTAVNFRFFEFLSNALFTLKIQTFDFGVIIIKDFFMLRITIGSFRFHFDIFNNTQLNTVSYFMQLVRHASISEEGPVMGLERRG